METCEICGSGELVLAYRGNVRDGAFGNVRDEGQIFECKKCGIQRLAEPFCIPDSYYETEAYRKKLSQELDDSAFYRAHDELQKHALQVVLPYNLRNKAIADIGCGAGSFTDHVAGLTSSVVAVEPFYLYRKVLSNKGYRVYPYASDAVGNGEAVDFAVSLQVIEHVRDPVAFLSDIRRLVKDNGYLVVSTPNRNDILMDLLPGAYPAFFYRVVHRWYYDAGSLSECAKRAGFVVDSVKYVHRYGLSNAFHWLRDRSPQGNLRLSGLEDCIDEMWKTYLQDRGKSDTIFAVLRAC